MALRSEQLHCTVRNTCCALQVGVDIVLEADQQELRRKSVALGQLFLQLLQQVKVHSELKTHSNMGCVPLAVCDQDRVYCCCNRSAESTASSCFHQPTQRRGAASSTSAIRKAMLSSRRVLCWLGNLKLVSL